MEGIKLGVSEAVSTADGRILAVYRFGKVGGFPVIYAHGWPGSGAQAQLAESAAERHGLELFAPDRPGIGGSSFVAGRRVLDWTEDVKAILDHYGISDFGLFAVSGGCPYALACAAAYPDQVSRVVICCGAALPETISDPTRSFVVYRTLARLFRWWPSGLRCGMHLARWIVRFSPRALYMKPMTVFLKGRDRKALRGEGAQAIFGKSIEEAFCQHPRGLVQDATRYAKPWGVDFHRIQAEVTFFHGDADQNIPFAAAEYTVGQVPGSRLLRRSGEGHYSLPIDGTDEMLALFR